LIHETSVASLVAGGGSAVNELLFREGDEGTLLDGPGTFDGTGGGESLA